MSNKCYQSSFDSWHPSVFVDQELGALSVEATGVATPLDGDLLVTVVDLKYIEMFRLKCLDIWNAEIFLKTHLILGVFWNVFIPGAPRVLLYTSYPWTTQPLIPN